ncbi:hypothetical protein HOY80DRAFT_1048162 [Tuber brumale]|nr:hypothetical protein HOY80DRAFT_1048162 [Tuber brumale]
MSKDLQGMRDLGQMALEILSIPAIIADEALAKLECTKFWIKDNFLLVTHPELQMIENLLDALVDEETKGGD